MRALTDAEFGMLTELVDRLDLPHFAHVLRSVGVEATPQGLGDLAFEIARAALADGASQHEWRSPDSDLKGYALALAGERFPQQGGGFGVRLRATWVFADVSTGDRDSDPTPVRREPHEDDA